MYRSSGHLDANRSAGALKRWELEGRARVPNDTWRLPGEVSKDIAGHPVRERNGPDRLILYCNGMTDVM